MRVVPFGKVQRNLPEVYVFIGSESWRKALEFQTQRPGTLCLPGYVSPFQFSWPVQGCHVLVFDTSYCHEDYIEDVVKCLFVYGATRVGVGTTDNKFFVFTKE